MFIVEWYDHEGDRHEMAFDGRADAEREATRLEENCDHVAVIWETEV